MAEQKTYQELKRELDGIMEVMQREDIDVDEAMRAYEAGMKVVAELEAYLKTAENKITKLKERFDA